MPKTPSAQYPREDLDCLSRGSIFLKCHPKMVVCLQISAIGHNQILSEDIAITSGGYLPRLIFSETESKSETCLSYCNKTTVWTTFQTSFIPNVSEWAGFHGGETNELQQREAAGTLKTWLWSSILAAYHGQILGRYERSATDFSLGYHLDHLKKCFIKIDCVATGWDQLISFIH